MDKPDPANFISAFTDLKPFQKEMLEKISKLDFAEIEERILNSMVLPRGKSTLKQVFIACDWANGIDHSAILTAQVRGGVMYIIDVLSDPAINVKAVQDLYRDDLPVIRGTMHEELIWDSLGHLDHLPPLAQDGIPEDHMHARRTKGKKKPLPYYHGSKRRF